VFAYSDKSSNIASERGENLLQNGILHFVFNKVRILLFKLKLWVTFVFVPFYAEYVISIY